MGNKVIEQFKLDLGSEFEENDELDTKYTTKIKAAQYECTMPSAPDLFLLVNKLKTNNLINEVERSNVSEKEKEFLKLAAYRHLVFNYELIAEYYAHASKEMQNLMEKSALVIIDIGDAIANGYVKLSENIEKIVRSNLKENDEEQIQNEVVEKQVEKTEETENKNEDLEFDLDLDEMLKDLE